MYPASPVGSQGGPEALASLIHASARTGLATDENPKISNGECTATRVLQADPGYHEVGTAHKRLDRVVEVGGEAIEHLLFDHRHVALSIEIRAALESATLYGHRFVHRIHRSSAGPFEPDGLEPSRLAHRQPA